MATKTNEPITPIRPLPGDSALLGVTNTAATRGGNGRHSRGGGGTSPQGHIPRKKFKHKSKKLKSLNLGSEFERESG